MWRPFNHLGVALRFARLMVLTAAIHVPPLALNHSATEKPDGFIAHRTSAEPLLLVAKGSGAMDSANVDTKPKTRRHNAHKRKRNKSQSLQSKTESQSLPSIPDISRNASEGSPENLIRENSIPVFAFDKGGGHDQMKKMVIDWIDFKTGNTHVKVALDTLMNRDSFQLAFDAVRKWKPPMVIWLLVFKDGDRLNIMPDLEQFFTETYTKTRHGVFHWPPERCDNHGLTSEKTLQTYRYAEFVFQFGYQDERVAMVDPDKFMPWPLGAAWWKGWEDPSPKSIIPFSKRPYMASFRGAQNTHHRFMHLQRIVQGISNVIVESSGKWVAEDSMSSVQRYKELLVKSKFTINLPGHNPNCYRLFESIQSGSIPIIFLEETSQSCQENWAAVYGNPLHTNYSWIPKSPFEVLNGLHDLKPMLQIFSLAATDDRRADMLYMWYTKWRNAFRNKLIEKIEFPMLQQNASLMNGSKPF